MAAQKQATSVQNGPVEILDDKKSGTRVFKKSSPNGKITVYLGKRDFVDYLTHTDIIDGVVLIDPEYVRDRRVFVHILAAFRYGREDLDVLGLTFRKDLFHKTQQVYPRQTAVVATSTTTTNSDNAGQSCEPQRKLTRLQERLLRKLNTGNEMQNAYPFFFELPHATPASVTLQPAAEDTGKPCGVDYELRAYVTDCREDKAHKRSSVSLAIRKLTYAPDAAAPQPCADAHKEFMMSPGRLRLEATLDKEKYYHGEWIHVNVLVDNNTSKSAKRLKISVRQVAEICLFSSATYKCTVAEIESEDGFPIHPNQTGWCKVFRLQPTIEHNRDKQGLALDGKLKHEDTNLASSTILSDATSKESMGIIVQYRVKVRLCCGFGNGDLSVELPFTLTHPKPKEEPRSPVLTNRKVADKNEQVVAVAAVATTVASAKQSQTQTSSASKAESQSNTVERRTTTSLPDGVVHDLINLDDELDNAQVTKTTPTASSQPARASETHVEDDDDLIFEDFARLRLQGQDAADLE